MAAFTLQAIRLIFKSGDNFDVFAGFAVRNIASRTHRYRNVSGDLFAARQMFVSDKVFADAGRAECFLK